MVQTIYWKDNKVVMLDQSRLPLEVKYIECDDYHCVAEAIKKLLIRGAPAIGIAASMGIALGSLSISASDAKDFAQKLQPVMNDLLATRPTAVNIKWAVNRFTEFINANQDKSVSTLKDMLIQEGINVLNEDIEINRSIGKWGAQFIKDGDAVLTHCNAGSLATGGYGTATSPMLIAKEQGKKFRVFADETRPVLQGARLTAWELMQSGIDVTLITDNSAGALMKKGMINLALVGTDRTARNGDVANKIGTYSVAVLCKEHKIPFYVAAPLSSIDLNMESGDQIPIEERAAEEVTTIWGHRVAPEGVKVMNMAFDVTPAKYVSAIITQKGVFRPEDLYKIEDENSDLSTIRINNK
ncbi:MAG: S-methyl-5-thioribose-1-phosphate isomerase [Dissulfurispiraceae bacterium]|jgi:methylthioribose-1-phosphate isomerase|nr:S-methyl-5-thioribose-1-phosphate isomerase [Dissulfurispiraceae bacterium]